jgi:hypothetical protein
MKMHTGIDQQFGYSTPDYVFTNADERARTRYSALSALHDAQSLRTMERLGVGKDGPVLKSVEVAAPLPPGYARRSGLKDAWLPPI